MTRRIILGCTGVLLLCLANFSSFSAGLSDIADAAQRGDKAGVRTLVQQKADINAPQVDGATALHWAVYRDDVEMADELIKAGAHVKATNLIGITPLYMAALYGNVPMIDRLLKAGADAKALGPNGETTVMLAARNGNPEAINLLLAGGVDINKKEPARGTTALMWAVEQQHPAAVKALLDAGADSSIKTGGAGLSRSYMAGAVGNAGVTEAARRVAELVAGRAKSFEDLAGRRGLVQGGQTGQGGQAAQPAPTAAAAPNVQAAPAGQPVTPAPQAAPAGDQRQAPAPARPAVPATPAPAAQAAPADDDDEDDAPVAGLQGAGGGGLTALVLAARQGDVESSRLLIAAGADVNQTTNYKWSPLLTAINNRNYQLGKVLIESGADVNLANQGGLTPLYLATDNRNIEGGDYPVPKPDMDHLEFIKILLDRGANPNAQVRIDTETRTIFTMQWFYERFGATPFMRAAQSGDTAVMKLLLAHGADPKIATDYGENALSVAAGLGWVEGITYETSVAENLEAVKMLLDLGLDPNIANRDGRTPLMGAAHKGRNDVIQLLVGRGARLDHRDKGSRDTDKVGAIIAGHTWLPLDYADGLVRVGVQSAIPHPETASLIRKLMAERGMPVPPPNRDFNSICIVEICKERQPKEIVGQ